MTVALSWKKKTIWLAIGKCLFIDSANKFGLIEQHG